jgi:hypothetical protein
MARLIGLEHHTESDGGCEAWIRVIGGIVPIRAKSRADAAVWPD